MADTIKVSVDSMDDILIARRQVRSLAEHLGFSPGDRTLLAAVITELCRNIVEHAGGGEVLLGVASGERTDGIVLVARDTGPGMEDTRRALEEGWAGARNARGLARARTAVDELEIESAPGRGTTVTVRKWTSRPSVLL